METRGGVFWHDSLGGFPATRHGGQLPLPAPIWPAIPGGARAAGWRGICRGGAGRRRGRCWTVAAGLNDPTLMARPGCLAVGMGLTWLLGPGPGLTRSAGFPCPSPLYSSEA